MLEQAASALNRQDYQTAAKLIAALVAERPDDPQVQLYAAQLQEATNKLDRALEIYRLLLQQTVNLKITTEARRGIGRIEELQAQDRASELAVARNGITDNIEPGFLVLEPISTAQKQSVVQKFAEIMALDPYSARLQLPSRGWRLYRLGQMGELEFYRDRLQQAQIPCFCVSQHDIQQMYIFRVSHFQSFHPQPTIVCTDDRAELRTFNFNWSEVTQIVTGILPIFEEVVEIDARNRTYRKPKILDYVQICDLQLRDRRSIFRLCSQTYNFCEYKQSIAQNRHQLTDDLSDRSWNSQSLPLTSRDNWKNLLSQIHEQIPIIPTHNNFKPFAETAIGYPELLQHIDPHIELLRRADSHWDRAFHLYSTLAMCRDAGGNSIA
ncbi:tol-pal system YbgF family protein [Chamaesiphon sp.]|uniref:tetratricopeptide repeat protein n=1 Tax=Chamaesiphon sp. TaxID=2814140 RepID=UPI0035931B00